MAIIGPRLTLLRLALLLPLLLSLMMRILTSPPGRRLILSAMSKMSIAVHACCPTRLLTVRTIHSLLCRAP
eukprot:13788574-Heterocapsa_arctica.AAC.1